MARLTLSQQVNELSLKLAAQTIELQAAQYAANEHHAALQHHINEMEVMRERMAKIPALQEEIAQLTKERDNARQLQNHYLAISSKAEAELEQSHAVLDGIDGAPAREYEIAYGKGQRSIVTRLAGAFLAIAKQGGVK